LELIRRQIAELYSPLLALNEKVMALVQLRSEISVAGGKGWQEVVEREGKSLDLDHRFRPFAQITEYNNKQLREEILPIYSEMIVVFTKGYWLAEESTRQHFGKLVKFREMWQRQMTDEMPVEVLRGLSPVDLSDLQEDLSRQISSLRAKLGLAV
jgi:hypothetical protein